MARVLITLDEPRPGPAGRMAGRQVRVHEMAGALERAGLDVVVAAPAEVEGIGRVDVWITDARMVATCAPRVRTRALVVDGYESPFGSFLHQAASLLPRIGARAVRDYRTTVVEQLAAFARADLILCATESQHLQYATILSMLGRIGPRRPDTDVVLRVSSGASPNPPARPRDETAHDPVVLWCGGSYPWFDVDTYLAALPRVVARTPRVRFRFAGIDGLRERADELPLARRIREVVGASPELVARAEFVPWRPYAERGALYAEADLGVCTYGDHLETRFAMRTRVIDMIWGGLPLVVSSGDEMSRVVEAHGLGAVVTPGDAGALAAAMSRLLANRPARRMATMRARALAQGDLSWDRQVAPLVQYCERVAAGQVAPRGRIASGDALVTLNDGRGRRVADRVAHVLSRARNAWGRLRRTPDARTQEVPA